MAVPRSRAFTRDRRTNEGRRRKWTRFSVAAFLMVFAYGACGCKDLEPSGPPPRALVFTPTDVAVISKEPQLDSKVARWSPRYQVERDGETAYLTYHNHGQHHRVPGKYPPGSSLWVIDVTTPQGTRTYMHRIQYSRFLLNYGNIVSSGLYEMRDEKAVKITSTATPGFLQAQARAPMPGIYVDPTGDLYALDPDHIIKMVRDGRVIATGDATKLPLHEPGGQPRLLFMISVQEERVLCVLKPKPRGIDHVPKEDDFDAKFTIQTP